MTSNPALLIFAKVPRAGQVKTRLCPPLEPPQAAGLYAAMLQDTLVTSGRLANVTRRLYYDPTPGARDWFASHAPGCRWFPQRGADLGERLTNAFATAFAAGHDQVVAIGSDLPHLPLATLQAAFQTLADGAPLVLGPADDGGYYLVGLGAPQPRLFTDIPWSSGQVLERTLQRAKQLKLTPTLLPLAHDLDTADDLRRPELWQASPEGAQTRAYLRRLRITPA